VGDIGIASAATALSALGGQYDMRIGGRFQQILVCGAFETELFPVSGSQFNSVSVHISDGLQIKNVAGKTYVSGNKRGLSRFARQRRFDVSLRGGNRQQPVFIDQHLDQIWRQEGGQGGAEANVADAQRQQGQQYGSGFLLKP